jgi:hypothetical protein
MPPPPIPRLVKPTTGDKVLDTWLGQLVDKLTTSWDAGATRMQGSELPQPTDADDGKALRWSKDRGWYFGT